MKKKITFFIITVLFLINPMYAKNHKCDIENYVKQSKNFLEKKDFKNNIKLCTDCIREYPDLAYLYNNRANSYKSLKLYEKAFDDYFKAMEIDPGYVTPYIGMGNLYFEAGQYDVALKCMDEAIKINSKANQAYNTRGMIKMLKGDFESAKSDFKKAKETGLPDEQYQYNMRQLEYLKSERAKTKK